MVFNPQLRLVTPETAPGHLRVVEDLGIGQHASLQSQAFTDQLEEVTTPDVPQQKLDPVFEGMAFIYREPKFYNRFSPEILAIYGIASDMKKEDVKKIYDQRRELMDVVEENYTHYVDYVRETKTGWPSIGPTLNGDDDPERLVFDKIPVFSASVDLGISTKIPEPEDFVALNRADLSDILSSRLPKTLEPRMMALDYLHKSQFDSEILFPFLDQKH